MALINLPGKLELLPRWKIGSYKLSDEKGSIFINIAKEGSGARIYADTLCSKLVNVVQPAAYGLRNNLSGHFSFGQR
jgi:hypothetical protein